MNDLGMSVRVVVVDDDPAIREVLAQIVTMADGLELAGTAADAGAGVLCCGATAPDVALVDVKMPGGGGPVAVQGIRKRSPDTRVVALSAYDDRATVLEMLRAGAVGYLVKGAPPEEIVAAVRAAAEGRSTIAGEVASEVVAELTGHLRRADEAERHQRARRARILHTIDSNGIDPVLQPIVDLERGSAVGYEALARFPREPNTSPYEWFAEAWRLDLGVEAEEYAARRALPLLDHLPDTAYLAVNLSPITIVERGMDGLLPALPGAERVVVEVTEHAPVADYERLAQTLTPFRQAGGRLAVDDVGAGYASLRHILRLDPDIIKIDISLTGKLDSDESKQALVTALVSFAGAVGATIVAEGVERADEVTALRELGVHLAQGYHLGRPRRMGAPGTTQAVTAS